MIKYGLARQKNSFMLQHGFLLYQQYRYLIINLNLLISPTHFPIWYRYNLYLYILKFEGTGTKI
jgi:hypothetical protein